MQETVNQEMETVNQTAETTQAETPKTFTQEDVNNIINKRFPNYKMLQEKAKKFDEIEESSKSELQKANDKVSELQSELNSLKKEREVAGIRSAVAKEFGVPTELLTAETQEDCEAQAKAINAYASAQMGYPTLKDGGEVAKATGGSTRQQFADWLNSNF